MPKYLWSVLSISLIEDQKAVLMGVPIEKYVSSFPKSLSFYFNRGQKMMRLIERQ